MVVLTLTTDSSDHTVRFGEPLYKFHITNWRVVLNITLAQLKSFWRNIYIRLPGQSRCKKIPESNYSLNSLGLALQETLKSEGGMVQMNTPVEWRFENA